MLNLVHISATKYVDIFDKNTHSVDNVSSFLNFLNYNSGYIELHEKESRPVCLWFAYLKNHMSDLLHTWHVC